MCDCIWKQQGSRTGERVLGVYVYIHTYTVYTYVSVYMVHLHNEGFMRTITTPWHNFCCGILEFCKCMMLLHNSMWTATDVILGHVHRGTESYSTHLNISINLIFLFQFHYLYCTIYSSDIAFSSLLVAICLMTQPVKLSSLYQEQTVQCTGDMNK
jgi:hypothetical protein